jgi:hypothetical protein
LTYGFFRKSDLDAEKPRIVAFVDFGHSKLSVTFASFTKGKMKVICTFSDKDLGARKIDYQLFELLGGEFAKKYGCDPRENIRCRLRLLDSIEKVRKLLTSNKEADVHCEALMEDEDLHRAIKREELEELIEPFVVKFKACLVEALEKSGKYSFKFLLHTQSGMIPQNVIERLNRPIGRLVYKLVLFQLQIYEIFLSFVCNINTYGIKLYICIFHCKRIETVPYTINFIFFFQAFF